MTTVAITGASGPLGTRVLERVRALRPVEQVVAVEVGPSRGPAPDDVEVRSAELTDERTLVEALEGVEVVVHLAQQVDPAGDPARMRAVNVDGTRHVVRAAADVGARKVVLGSSTMVHGAHPDNDVPLTEESPLRANPDFPYAEHLRDVEAWIEEAPPAVADLVVTRLRLATVVGTGGDTPFTRALLGPRLPSVRGHRPPFQFLHVDDAASAVAHAVAHDLAGAYHVGAEGWLSFDEVAAILGRKPLDVPEEVAFTTVERLSAIGLADLPIGAVHYLMHPWVASVDRLVATGWRPVHSNRDAVADLATDLGDRLVFGPVRTSRHQVRRGAAASVGIAGGLLALGLIARRRGGGGA